MAAKKKGFIAKMIEGPERSEEYARSSLPGNRWELGWDIFKNNLGKLVGINILMLLFLLPLIALIVFRNLFIESSATLLPFGQNVGIGYPLIQSTAGLSESVTLQADLLFILLPICALIAAVGISGGMYVIRNMVWAESVMVGHDFWAGVKKNYGVVVVSSLIYSVLVFMAIYSIDTANYVIAAGTGINWLLTVSIVISYIMLVFFSIMYLYSLTLGVTFKLKFRHLIKNSFIMSIALIPFNLFFALFGGLSLILILLGGFFQIFGIMLFIIFGISLFALIWTDYSQWTFDKYINDKVPGAKINRGIYSKNPSEEEPDFSFEASTLGKRPIKPITDYDVEIAALPENFSRADLVKLEESKKAMREDSDEYVSGILDEIEKEKQLKEEADKQSLKKKKTSNKNEAEKDLTVGDETISNEEEASPETDVDGENSGETENSFGDGEDTQN